MTQRRASPWAVFCFCLMLLGFGMACAGDPRAVLLFTFVWAVRVLPEQLRWMWRGP